MGNRIIARGRIDLELQMSSDFVRVILRWKLDIHVDA